MRITVVGGGIIGLSAARALVAAGHRVTLLEQGPFPNPLASSSDRHRLIRFMYGHEHGYAAMVAEAYPAWERLWRDLGRIHYAPTGQLLSGPPDDPWVAGSRQSLASLGIACSELERADIHRRFPLVDADQVDYALYSPTAGALFADAIARDLGQWLAEHGVEVLPQRTVAAVDPATGAVILVGGDRLAADRVVVAAGPWTGRLRQDLGRGLTPSRQVVAYVEPPADLAGHWAETTMLTDVLQGDQQSVFYAVPPLRGLPVKFGDHCFSKGGDPDEDRTPTAAEIARVMDAARRRLRDVDRYRVIEARTCFYTLTADERFVVESVGRCLTLAGFSGHGYKFGPLIGERLAELVGGRLALDAFRTWLAGAAPLASGAGGGSSG